MKYLKTLHQLVLLSVQAKKPKLDIDGGLEKDSRFVSFRFVD